MDENRTGFCLGKSHYSNYRQLLLVPVPYSRDEMQKAGLAIAGINIKLCGKDAATQVEVFYVSTLVDIFKSVVGLPIVTHRIALRPWRYDTWLSICNLVSC